MRISMSRCFVGVEEFFFFFFVKEGKQRRNKRKRKIKIIDGENKLLELNIARSNDIDFDC